MHEYCPMKRSRSLIFLFSLGLFAVGMTAAFQSTPGYMDADYYFAGGLRLVGGYGFSEPFVWNYLGGEAILPEPGVGSLEHASHAYWMPLASLLAASGMVVSGIHTFFTARIGFLLVAALVPPLTMALTRSLLKEKVSQAEASRISFLAGLLAVFPGFYLAYLSTTDTFGIYMLLGGLWFLVVGRASPAGAHLRFLILGALSGGMHLARADGVLWLGLGLFAALWLGRKNKLSSFEQMRLLGLTLVGYLLVFGPWLLRSHAEFGSLLAPVGARVLWLTHYDELYAYPASLLTRERWLASGLGAIIQARFDALGQNLQSALAVQGQIYLLPFMLLGGWRWRSDWRAGMGVTAWLLTLGVMTVAFPYAGARGGYFHSGAALQPILWAFAAAGLDVFVAWGRQRRGWHSRQAQLVFSAGLVLLGFVLTVFLVQARVIGQTPQTGSAWDVSHARYERLEKALQSYHPEPGDVVLVNNPPGYYLASGRQAGAIPYGSVDALRAAAERLGARYLLLELDQVQHSSLYSQPENQPGLRYLGSTSDEVRIYEFTDIR
jgi:hypothetical protein